MLVRSPGTFQPRLFNPGLFNPEFFNPVAQKLMVETMKKAGCHLVDTANFSTVYEINKEWFNNVIDYEENQRNKRSIRFY